MRGVLWSISCFIPSYKRVEDARPTTTWENVFMYSCFSHELWCLITSLFHFRLHIDNCSCCLQFDPPRYPKRLGNSWNRDVQSVHLESDSFVIMMESWLDRSVDVFLFSRTPSVKWCQDVFFFWQIWAVRVSLAWLERLCAGQPQHWDSGHMHRDSDSWLSWWIVEGMLRLKGPLWSSQSSTEVQA